MTTIESLPIETLTQIIEEVAALDDRRSLLYCSRVSRRWTDISLARLYEHLEIMTIKVAEAFAHSAALTRYRTRLLYIGCPCDWSVDLWKILNGCPELKELHLGPYLQEVPTNLFLHPSLAKLESLILRCHLEFNQSGTANDHDHRGLAIRLKELSTDLQDNQIIVIQRILQVSSTIGQTPRFTTLHVTDHDNWSNMKNLPMLAPLTKSLHLPPLDGPWTDTVASDFSAVTNFLNKLSPQPSPTF